jgi:iron complex outermembrane receptor protein
VEPGAWREYLARGRARAGRCFAASLCLGFVFAPGAGAAQAEPLVEEITVNAPTRLGGGRTPGDGLNVQVITAAELEASGAQTFQEALRRLPGLNLSDEQGNRFQQDLTMRGFTASPVTGMPQTLSVFVDGVRVNEPAVEEVNFDLLPLEDIERIEVIRGPNAIYGRNTIGGAINIVTRRGGKGTDAEVEVEAGSWLLQAARARVSGPLGPLDGYLSLGELTERGWRDDGGSKGFRGYGKLGLRLDATDVWLSYQFQRDHLSQPGSLPQSMLLENPRQNYTAGDFFQPTLNLVTLNAEQRIGSDLSITANGFVRTLNAEQFNSSLLSPDTRLFNDTVSLGAALQVDHRATLGAVKNHFTAGAEAGLNTVHILVSQEANAQFQTGDNGEPLPQLVGDLSDTQRLFGAFVQDELRVSEGPLAGLGVRAAIRFDLISHDITDTSPPNPGGATGTVDYSSWTPAVGVTWAFLPNWLASVSYARGFRAPAFLEITCADPAAPCVGLQAGVAPDATFTALQPVTSQTFEAGVTGSPAEGVTASLNAFLVDLKNDIYSVSAEGSTAIYFRNVGPTRRQGFEASLRVQRGIFGFNGTYAYTLATFQEDLILGTPRTPDGIEFVKRGDQLPLVPNNILNLEGRVRPLDWLTLTAGALFVGSQYFRGDEANEAPKLPSYWVLRAGAEVQWKSWSAFVRVANLLNSSYQTFGTFAPDGRTPGEPVVPFLTPGLPVRFTLGIRWALD